MKSDLRYFQATLFSETRWIIQKFCGNKLKHTSLNTFKPNDSLANNEDLDDVDLSAIEDEVLAEGTVDASTGGVQVKCLD